MSDEEKDIDVLLELFGWNQSPSQGTHPATLETRFQALVVLRRARKQETPAWDDYVRGIRR